MLGLAGMAALVALSNPAVSFAQQRPLRIGCESNPPIQIRTASGFSGLTVETVSEAARRAGFEAAVTNRTGNVVDGHKDHLWALPRQWAGYPHFSVSALESRMSGYGHFMRGQFRPPMVTH